MYEIIERYLREIELLLNEYLDHYGHRSGPNIRSLLYGGPKIIDDVYINIKFIGSLHTELNTYFENNKSDKYLSKQKQYNVVFKEFKEIVGLDDDTDPGIADTITIIRKLKEVLIAIKHDT